MNLPKVKNRSQDDSLMSFARTIPFWFLAIVGLIYASGFLVVTTHLDMLGIRDVGSELWKSRYIHIGVLSLGFPIMIVSTVYVFAEYIIPRKFEPYKKPQPKGTAILYFIGLGISLLIFLSSELTYYAFAMFVRRFPSSIKVTDKHLPEDIPAPLMIIIMIGVVVLIFITMLNRYLVKKKCQLLIFMLSCTTVLRLIILVTVLYYSSKAILAGGYIGCIWEIMHFRWHSLSLMVICWAVFGCWVYILKRNETESTPKERALGWIFLLPLPDLFTISV